MNDAAQRIIQIVRHHNDHGTAPSKADVCHAINRAMPNRTRAGKYRQIDQLLRTGELHNIAPVGAPYRLVVAGHTWWPGPFDPVRAARVLDAVAQADWCIHNCGSGCAGGRRIV